MWKNDPEAYVPVLDQVLVRLGTLEGKREALIIAVDGRYGAGKTHFATWLGWQLGAPVVSLDLYFSTQGGLRWRARELRRLIRRRLLIGPVVVEGSGALKALQRARQQADVVIWVENANDDDRADWPDEYESYRKAYRLPEVATHHVRWKAPDHLADRAEIEALRTRIGAKC